MSLRAVARSCLVVSPRASAAFETIIRIWEENSIFVGPELFNVMAQIILESSTARLSASLERFLFLDETADRKSSSSEDIVCRLSTKGTGFTDWGYLI